MRGKCQGGGGGENSQGVASLGPLLVVKILYIYVCHMCNIFRAVMHSLWYIWLLSTDGYLV